MRPDDELQNGHQQPAGYSSGRVRTETTSSDPTAVELRSEIVNSRAALRATVGEIEDRLDPELLKGQLKQSVRDATLGRAEKIMNQFDDNARYTSAGIFDTMRRNPVPAALAGFGLAWLWLNRSTPPRRYDRYNQIGRGSYEYPRTADRGQMTVPGMQPPDLRAVPDRLQETAQEFAGQARDQAHQLGDQLGDVTDQARQSAGQLGDQLQQSAGQIGDQFQQVAGQARQTADQIGGQLQTQAQQFGNQIGSQLTGLTNQVQSGAQSVGSQLQGQFLQGRGTFEQTLQDNPFTIGAVALALGVAAGFALPSMPREEQVLGGARQQLAGTIRSAAHGAMDQVQQMASQVQQAAQNPEQNLGTRGQTNLGQTESRPDHETLAA